MDIYWICSHSNIICTSLIKNFLTAKEQKVKLTYVNLLPCKFCRQSYRSAPIWILSIHFMCMYTINLTVQELCSICNVLFAGNTNAHGLDKCMKISILDRKAQQDPAQWSRGRRQRPRVCNTEGSFDWLVDPVMKPHPPPTQSPQSTLPFNGLVLTGRGIHQAASPRDDSTTSAPEEKSPQRSNVAKITEKEHHVTFHQLPKHHRRQRCEVTDAFSVTGLTSMKEKQTVSHSPLHPVKMYSDIHVDYFFFLVAQLYLMNLIDT